MRFAVGDGLSVLGVGSGLSVLGVGSGLSEVGDVAQSPPPAAPLSTAPDHVGTHSDDMVVVRDAMVVARQVGDTGELYDWLSAAAVADGASEDRSSDDEAADSCKDHVT